MMKLIAAFLFLAVAANMVEAEMQCSIGVAKIPVEWINMTDKCITQVRKQIQMEIDASYQYLAMAAHFSRDTVNRPGFAKKFFEAAKEEREHGAKLIEYLSMRGELTANISNLIAVPTIDKQKWDDGVEALENALKLETEVTISIRNLIKICERNQNDYHLVDYLTGVYLEEQYKGQRELAGELTTLKKMKANHGPLGEFLFDKNL